MPSITSIQPSRTVVDLALGRPVARIENLATAKRVVHGQLGHFLGAYTADAQAIDVAFMYGPFGEILAQSGAEADYTERFNGKEQDQLTDLSYYGFRYFDPYSLTWTQADPLYRFAPDAAWDEPRRASLYTFTLNNPLAMVDPDGLWPRPPGGRMGPSGDNTGETLKKGAVLFVNRTASIVSALPFVPPQVRAGAAIVAAATSESGPPIDLANVDPASLPGPPGGPRGPPGPRVKGDRMKEGNSARDAADQLEGIEGAQRRSRRAGVGDATIQSKKKSEDNLRNRNQRIRNQKDADEEYDPPDPPTETPRPAQDPKPDPTPDKE